MYQKLMHNKSLRLIGGLLGGLLLSVAINVFIVPQGLYGGGAYGLCQVIRTLLQRELSLSLPFDLAGVLYFFVNIPLFLLAYKALGREFFWKAAICTVCNSVFLAVIPSPSTPVIPDLLTSCMVGGILAGFASGLVLTCGCSTGGLDILGLYLSKKGSRFTVGRFSISFNALLYTLCFFLFDATTAIYSAIYCAEQPVSGPHPPAKYYGPAADLHQEERPPAAPLHHGAVGPGRYQLDGPGRLDRRRGAGALRLPVQV